MARCMHACMHENIANVHMVGEAVIGAPIRFALCENVMQAKISQTLLFLSIVLFAQPLFGIFISCCCFFFFFY